MLFLVLLRDCIEIGLGLRWIGIGMMEKLLAQMKDVDSEDCMKMNTFSTKTQDKNNNHNNHQYNTIDQSTNQIQLLHIKIKRRSNTHTQSDRGVSSTKQYHSI